MAFLNALGRVSRRGQWRFRKTFRAADATGRLDQSDDGLIAWDHVTAASLALYPRPPYPGWAHGCEPDPLVSASLADGRLVLLNPGILEAVFPDGWAAGLAPGRYDLRFCVTVGPETVLLLDEPLELA